MGCDIHWYSETRKNGKWVCDQAHSFETAEDAESSTDMDSFPNRDRDYWFFGLLQPDVRTCWYWSFPESNIPNDLSKEVGILYAEWSSDAHSGGSRTRKALKAKREELKTLQMSALVSPGDTDKALSHHADRLEETISALDSDVPDTDQRIVFWFDN